MIDKETRRLRSKLTRVITKAGLSFVTYSSLVDYVDDLPGGHKTAVWIFDRITKKEKVLFHKEFLNKMPVPMLVLVLRHEFLHKAMYRNIKGASNHFLVNVALDAAINKILFLSNPKGMIRLYKMLIPIEERLSVLCVLNPSITTNERNKLDNRLQTIFDDIYLTERNVESRTDSGNYMSIEEKITCADVLENPYLFNKTVPEPLTLYNKLASLLSTEQKKEIAKLYDWLNKDGARGEKKKEQKEAQQQLPEPFEDDEEEVEPDKMDEAIGETDDHHYSNDDIGKRVVLRGGENKCRANDKKTIECETKTIHEMFNESYSQMKNLKAYFDKHIYKKETTETDGLNDFISQWQTEKQIETAITTIYNEVRSMPTIDPVPLELTRTGFELVVLDVSGPDQIPLYFNQEKQGAKKKICCYFDTSPSMHHFIPYMVSIAEFFDSSEECEIAGGEYKGRYCFSEKVQGIEEWQEFIEGKVSGGYGTSFEIVVRHALERINDDDCDIVVVFTDGLSGVNKETIEEFNKTGRKCYTIYFKDPHKDYHWFHTRSRENKQEWERMHSDLDRLTGDNFTIFCDTTKEEEAK